MRIPRFVLLALVAVACNPRPSLPIGSDCELASQCATPLVCRLGRCRDECRSDRDCRAGLACQLDANHLGACALQGETCVRNSDCPMTLVCLMGRCANACDSDVDCLPGARCVADPSGARGCHDTFMMHCQLNSECSPPLICANDGNCREQCETNRDCRDGTVCDTTGSPRTCVWPSDGGSSDGGASDGSVDTGVDASIDSAGIDLGMVDVGVDAFAFVDMGRVDVGVDMGFDAGPMIDTGCVDAFATVYDSGVVTPATPSSLIAGGATHTCAIQLGSLRCWGDDTLGQLGDGLSAQRSTSAAVGTIAATATTVTSGRNFACATTASAVWCWGENALGQVGNGGTASPQRSPVMISAMAATKIAAGDDHACLLRAGTVSCWGDNSFGQIGDGTTMPRTAPTPTLALARPAVDIDAGGRATCAVLDDGRVQCWGENQNGQLGIGSTSAGPNPTPQIVSSLADALEVTVGTANACARRIGGEVSCWGDNLSGELGDGTTSCVSQRTTPGQVGTLPTAVEMAASLSHVCARINDGSVWCWGDNGAGATGAPLSMPVTRLPHRVAGVSGAIGIGVSEGVSCAHVSTGIVCWGDDTNGQLGNGMTGTITNTPQAVIWL